MCHIYLDASADPEMATNIVLDSKLKQMAVCNGLETLLVHREAAPGTLPRVLKALHEEGVEIRGDAATCEVIGDVVCVSDGDWVEEYLVFIVVVCVVDDMDQAIEHIRIYGSDYIEVIVIESYVVF